MVQQVQAQVVGGSVQTVNDVATVGDVAKKLNIENHTATVNGEPADSSYTLRAFDFVSFAKQVKGA